MSAVASLPVRAATEEDLPDALALLAAAGLPSAGVEGRFPRGFLVARDPADGRLLALAGVEAHGDVGLLRSVAVDASRRGTGLGRTMAEEAVRRARDEGLSELYLLTTTAEGWFPRLGFARVERASLPAALGASEELRGACPASAVAMRLAL